MRRSWGAARGSLTKRRTRSTPSASNNADRQIVKLQQRASELLLEALDLLRERRLGDEQLFGGARERAFVGDRLQVLQLSKVHGRASQPIEVAYRDCKIHVFALSTGGRDSACMTAISINHVSVHAHDLERSAAFYERLFGMERIPTPTFERPVVLERGGLAMLAAGFQCFGMLETTEAILRSPVAGWRHSHPA